MLKSVRPRRREFFKCAFHLGLGLGGRARSSVVEQSAHNRLVAGSIPAEPTSAPHFFRVNDAVWKGTTMPLQLDHTIVPAYDKVKSAEFIARMFGLKYEGPWGHFAPVKVNDILTLDFDDSKTLGPITTPSWPRTRSSTRSCSGSGTRGSSSGAGRARGRTGRSTTCTRGAGYTSSARTAMCGRLLRTRILRIEGQRGCWRGRAYGRWSLV